MSHGGCWPGLTVRDDARGVPGCRSGCLHRSLVEEYRDAKILSDEARKLQRERETGGFPAESAEWDRTHPTFTFKDFLVDRKGSRVVDMTAYITHRGQELLRREYEEVLDHYAGLTDDELRELAIEFRNEILDELRRREETMEARAEERRYDIPTWPYAR